MNSPQPKQLWKDYYTCKKPRCINCTQQEIAEDEYKFCSLEKKPSTVYDDWGKKVIHVFNDLYACNVYH